MSEWKQCEWKNLQGIYSENERLSVVILPELGGKIASLYYKPQMFELAAQYSKESYELPSLDADFSLYDASGLDDTFPNIDANTINYQGKELVYPDHGEIWSSPLDYEIKNDSIGFFYRSRRFPYSYEKEVSLEEDALVLRYRIINEKTEPFPCIWTFHGLFRYEEDMKLIFPDKVKQFIKIFESPLVGDQYTCKSINIPPRNSNAMGKYYVDGKVDQGYCGYYYPKQRVQCLLKYDPVKLPYIGIWITAGGYRGDYNCALEPSNGFYDDVEIARKNGCLFFLEPNQPLEFSLRIEVNALN